MSETLDAFRQQYPAYKDVPDRDLADALYDKFYKGKLSKPEYDQQLGLPPVERDISLTGIAKDMGSMLAKEGKQQAHNVATGFVRGAGSLVDMGNSLLNPEAPFAYPPMHPGTDAANWFLKNVMPPAPQRHIGDALVQGGAAGAASMPFGLPISLIGAGSGALTEAAAKATDHNPGAVVGTSLLAPLLLGGPAALRGNASRMLARRAPELLGPVPGPGLATAQQREAMGNQVGFPLAGPESMDNPALRQLAADTAASRTGGPIMGEFFDRRPDLPAPPGSPVQYQYGQFRSVMTPLLDAIAPATRDTGEVAGRVQGAAENALRQAETTRTALVTPYYRRGANDPVAPAEFNALVQQIDARLADAPASIAGPLRQFRADLFDANGNPKLAAGQLDDVYKLWRERVELPPTDANNLQKGVARALPIEDTGNVVTRASPETAYGRSLYADLSQTTVGPLRRSDVGQVANRAGIPENIGIQGQLNFITDPKKARPEGIEFMARVLNQQDPQAFPQLARVYLENAMEEAARRLQSGPNRALGSKFANIVASGPEESANLTAILRGVAEAHGLPADALLPGFRNALSVMERSGSIPGTGSPTAARLGSNAEAGATLAEAGNPKAYIQRIWSDAMNGRAYRQLAEAFTAPNSIEAMRRLAMLNPSDARANLIVAELLGWRPAAAEAPPFDPSYLAGLESEAARQTAQENSRAIAAGRAAVPRPDPALRDDEMLPATTPRGRTLAEVLGMTPERLNRPWPYGRR